MLEGLEHLVGGDGEDGVAAAAGEPAEGVGEEGLADADGADDGDVGVGVEEAQRDELVPERAVVGDLGRRVPVLELHGGIELGLGGAQRDGGAVAARDLVAEDEEQEVLVRHLLLARQDEALGQRVEQAAELEAAQHGREIGGDRVGRHRCTSLGRGGRAVRARTALAGRR